MEQKLIPNSPIVCYISRSPGSPWLMLVHAAFVDHHMFDAQICHFQGQYNIIALDLLGHGASVPGRKGDSVDKMAQWMDRILQEEQIERVHLVGVSLGAVIVQDFANKFPKKVASLACFGGYDINNFDPKLQKGNRSAHMGMMMKALFSIKWFAEENKQISAYTKEAQDAFYQMNLRFPKPSFLYLAALGSLVNKYPTGTRNYPLLIGCGEHDIPMELEAVEMWATAEPNAKKIIFPGAGHCVNMDVPDVFNRTMASFWAVAETD